MSFQFYVTIEGAEQGKFKGEVAEKELANKIGGLAFDFEVTAPYDKATGMSSGKRQMSPVKFVKEWGAASPQIFQALAKNEVIKSVLFEFYRSVPQGGRVCYYTIKLTNGKIVHYHQFVATSARQQLAIEGSTTHELEEVAFVFQKIDVENKDAKTMAMDTAWPS